MNTRRQLRRDLIKLLCTISDPKEMEAALEAILTPRELEGIENRLQIFRLLAQAVPQREIAAQLNVGIATVTRGANALRNSRFFEQYPLTAEQPDRPGRK